MLNVREPGTVLPRHRHLKSSETIVCLRGHLREIYYNDRVTRTSNIRCGESLYL